MTPLVFYLLILTTPATHERQAYLLNDLYTCTNVISALAAWVLAYAPGASLSACLPVAVTPADWIVGDPPTVRPMPIPLTDDEASDR